MLMPIKKLLLTGVAALAAIFIIFMAMKPMEDDDDTSYYEEMCARGDQAACDIEYEFIQAVFRQTPQERMSEREWKHLQLRFEQSQKGKTK
jgi:hypothetical protein